MSIWNVRRTGEIDNTPGRLPKSAAADVQIVGVTPNRHSSVTLSTPGALASPREPAG